MLPVALAFAGAAVPAGYRSLDGLVWSARVGIGIFGIMALDTLTRSGQSGRSARFGGNLDNPIERAGTRAFGTATGSLVCAPPRAHQPRRRN